MDTWNMATVSLRKELANADGEVLFVLVATLESHWMNLRVCEATGWDDEGPIFEKSGQTSGPIECTHALDDAVPLWSGFIKWDGCAEIAYGCEHVCNGPGSFTLHHMALQWAFREVHSLHQETWPEAPLEWKPSAVVAELMEEVGLHGR